MSVEHCWIWAQIKCAERGIPFHPEWEGLEGFMRFQEHVGVCNVRGAFIALRNAQQGYVEGNVYWADRVRSHADGSRECVPVDPSAITWISEPRDDRKIPPKLPPQGLPKIVPGSS